MIMADSAEVDVGKICCEISLCERWRVEGLGGDEGTAPCIFSLENGLLLFFVVAGF